MWSFSQHTGTIYNMYIHKFRVEGCVVLTTHFLFTMVATKRHAGSRIWEKEANKKTQYETKKKTKKQ